MLSLKTKQTSQTSSIPIDLSNDIKKENSSLSFSQLLKGIQTPEKKGMLLDINQKDEKDTKTPKKDTLLSLIQNSKDNNKSISQLLQSNSQIENKFNPSELKQLVFSAKKFLKEQIIQSDGFKKVDIKQLPHTLKGLIQFADKIGIDISKITLEQIQNTPKNSKPIHSHSTQQIVDTKQLDATNSKPLQEGLSALLKGDKKITTTPVHHSDTKPLEIDNSKPLQEGLSTLLKGDEKITEPLESYTTQELKQLLQLNPQLENKFNPSELKQLIFDAKKFLKEQIIQSDGFKKADIKEIPHTLKGLIKLADKIGIDISKITVEQVQNTPKNNLSTPIFQQETSKSVHSHSTQQIVQTKQMKIEPKTPKNRADETLQLLLRGEKANSNNTESSILNLTKEFSKTTATVVTPKASTELTKNLESLLHTNTQEDSELKTNNIATPKADALEVKIKEAKQMIHYLSSDVKNAIDEYKSPFTRIKLQLNPQDLGKVDLTIVQRGKNLHVNIGSNNTAIQTLALNVNDLRVQLQNNGINNATLNFNNNTQSESQQQNKEHQQKASHEYKHFDEEQTNEEVLNSLEIVVPYYA